MRLLSIVSLIVVVAGVQSPCHAIDPRNPSLEFVYQLYPPDGFSVKKSKAVMRADKAQPKAYPLIGPDGKFTPLGQWYYDLGSDPRNFATWWYGYFSDAKNWPAANTPVYKGTGAINQGHRIVAWLGTFNKLIQNAPDIDPEVKRSLCSEAWKRSVEKTIRSTINSQGALEHAGNTSAMAQVFHFLRTKFGAMGLRVENIYTLDHAQNLICTLLTESWIISADDRYLDPPDIDYLEKIGKQYAGTESDIRLIKGGKVFYSGGLFIGWKNQPSLHGAWDGLTIINSLFKYYRDSDPDSPQSIFYKWNRLPEEKRQIGRSAIVLCSRRLWLDWQENQGKTWCWVRNGQPVADMNRPSEAPFLPAYDGYGDNQVGWAKACWDEMFGNPTRNTNDGVQALLAIAHGRIHRDLKTPMGQQVPGRFEFDPVIQKKQLAEDEARLKTKSAESAPEEPKLDPAKSKNTSE